MCYPEFPECDMEIIFVSITAKVWILILMNIPRSGISPTQILIFVRFIHIQQKWSEIVFK